MVKIHAVKVPMVEFELDNKTYKFVYNLATMNYISQLAKEERLPNNITEWDEDHIRVLLEATGLTHHPDEDWDKVFEECSASSIVELGIAIVGMITEENSKAFGRGEVEMEENMEPTPEPAKRRGRKPQTG